jgi:hypothetical protein
MIGSGCVMSRKTVAMAKIERNTITAAEMGTSFR